MKIDTTSGIRRSAPKGGVKSQSSVNGSFKDNLGVQEAPLPKEVVELSQVAQTSGLLSIQEYPTLSPDDKKRMVHSEGILDRLDALQVALINGRVSKETLDQLTEALGHEWKPTMDAGLKSLFDEIEIRGAVELAKLERVS